MKRQRATRMERAVRTSGSVTPHHDDRKAGSRGYFASPVAYVFIVIFLLLSGFLTFMVGGFFEHGQANLQPFFAWHPWLYLFLVPAVGMRMWSEERRMGTIESCLRCRSHPGRRLSENFSHPGSSSPSRWP